MTWLKFLFPFAEWWIENRPIERWRERRQQRRAAREGKAMNDDQKASLIRTVAKTVGGLLVGFSVTHGYIDASQAASVIDAIVGLAGAAAVIYGAVSSHKANAT